MITDSNYVLPTRIAIRSMLRYKRPDTEYAIHILGVSLTEKDMAELKTEYAGVDIMECADRYRDFCKCFTHVSTAALYKFDMAELFPQYEKIIYIDSDVLVLDDLTELFSLDVSGVYAAVVKDLRGMSQLKLQDKLGLKYYFFSGMMVANLTRWRTEKLREQFLEKKKANTYNGCMDQDVFNVVFHDCIRILPVRYNCPSMLWWGAEGALEAFYSGDELRQISEFREGKIIPGDTVVIHYFMKAKPWISLRNNVYMRYWWRFLTPGERVRLYGTLVLKKVMRLCGGKK